VAVRPLVAGRAPGRWQVGAVRITQVVESQGASPPSFLFADLSAELRAATEKES